MRRLLTAIGGLMLALTVLGVAQDEAPLNLQSTRGGRTIPDHYIVVLKDGADPRAVAQRHGATSNHVYSTVLNGFAARLNRGQLQRVLRDADVQYVDEDGVVEFVQENPQDLSPAVVQPGAVWNLDKLDQEWGGGLNGTYNYTDTGAGVNVYMVGTGIRTTHNEFDGAALNRAKAGASGFDAFGGNGQDCNGLGTHVAGTIGGTTYGIAKAVKLYSVRVVDCAGSGTWAGFIAGAEWITNNHIKPAVAHSVVGGPFTQSANDAVTRSVSWGVTWVVNAGSSNDNACNYSPSSTPAAITVAATDSNNNRASFSNWGPCVDINAPGVNITSAWSNSDVAVSNISGTSAASAHAAGLAALYLVANKVAAPGEVEDAVENSAVNGVVAGLPGGTPNLLAHKVNGQIPGAGACINGSLGNLPQEPDTFNNQCYYWSPNSSYHHVRIRGTPGTNYNVEFYRFVGSNWVKVAQKISGSTNEYLKTFQPGGFFYMYLVRPVSGTGTYDSWVINAGMRAQP